MPRTLSHGWHRPSSYSLSGGVKPQNQWRLLRVVLPIAIVLNGAAFLAIFQVNQRLDAAFRDKPTVTRTQARNPAENSTESVQPVSSVASASVVTENGGLQELLQQWASSHSDHTWSVAVQSLGANGGSASVNGDNWYNPASVYKLLVMYPLFERYSLSDLDTRQVKAGDKTYTLRQCVEAMLLRSDNECGEAVGSMLGWYRIDSALHNAGYKQLQLNRKDGMQVNAKDAANYMRDLYEGKLLDADEREYVLDLLSRQTLRQGIPTGCLGCQVADKTGDFDGVRNDVGVVTNVDKTFVISIFTNGAPYGQIAELTRQVNDYLDNN